ncbi:MAG: hypothetical protein KY462_15960 [Actinobacteria bacterium]|nr:hypothetical protein [Actinomycetota bacterium]
MGTRAAHLRLTGDEQTPLVFRGPPRRLRGRLPVANTGQRRGVLREAVLQGSPELLGDEQRVCYRLGATVLRPEQRSEVGVALTLNPATRPGEYQLEVEVGGEVRPVVVQVLEELRLSVSPAQLVVENRPGEVQTKRVVVDNRGNVDLTIGAVGDAVLNDELFECRALRRALRELTDEDAEAEGNSIDLDAVLTKVAHASQHVLDRANHLRVRNASGRTVIEPGRWATIDLEIEVPDTLSQHTRYWGTVPIYTHDLAFVVVPYRPEDTE